MPISRRSRPVLAPSLALGACLALGLSACRPPRAADADAAIAALASDSTALPRWLAAQGIPIVTRADWGAAPPVLPTTAHRPTRLTIHHTGTAMNPQRSLEAKLRGLQQFSQRDDSLSDGRKKPAWADVPYHFYVSVDGRVGEGREWRWKGDSNTPYDPTGHLLVVIEGSFDRDTLTSAQRATLDRLIPALAHRFAIPATRLGAHKDFAQTDCPGAHVMEEMPRWREAIGS